MIPRANVPESHGRTEYVATIRCFLRCDQCRPMKHVGGSRVRKKHSYLSWRGYKPLTHRYFGVILAHAATEIAKNTTLQKFQKIDTAIETMGNNLVQALILLKSQTLSVCYSKNMCLDNVVSNCSSISMSVRFRVVGHSPERNGCYCNCD